MKLLVFQKLPLKKKHAFFGLSGCADCKQNMYITIKQNFYKADNSKTLIKKIFNF
jgi:hypothetical protein